MIFKPLKFPAETPIYFCSDFHLWHNRDFLYEPRGFKNTQENVDFIKDSINATPEGSVIIHCGDIAVGCDHALVKDFIYGLQRNVYHILGNHESQIRMICDELEDPVRLPMRIGPNFTIVGKSFEVQRGKKIVYCSHYPHECWDKSHRGRVSVSGHSHGGIPKNNPSGSGRPIDVGVENAKEYNGTALFSMEEIFDIAKNKPILDSGHHNKDTS